MGESSMIAYPYSGEIQSAYIDNYPQYEDFARIVDDYCKVYRLTPEDIRLKIGIKRRPKVYKSVHIDYIRMALAYYFNSKTNLTQKEIAMLAGYSDQSAIPRSRETAKKYISVNDELFLQYWQTLLKIV